MVCCTTSSGQTALGQPETDEAMPRIEFDFADLGREDDPTMSIPSLNAVDVESESLSATLCPMKAFSEYLVESILTFVEALGRNMVMLHTDQEPVLMQLLEAWIVFGRRRAHIRERLGQSTKLQPQQSWRGDRDAQGAAAVLCTDVGEQRCQPSRAQDPDGKVQDVKHKE